MPPVLMPNAPRINIHYIEYLMVVVLSCALWDIIGCLYVFLFILFLAFLAKFIVDFNGRTVFVNKYD